MCLKLLKDEFTRQGTFSHYLLTHMQLERRVKCRRLRHISGASLQNSIAAGFQTAAVNGSLLCHNL